MSSFSYDEAFSRNIGLLTEEEQHKLKRFTIAIPGMGGVGGAHLITLVRAGFEKFKIADMDTFEVKNFNRQYGAQMSTVDKEKVKVMMKKALEINPECKIKIYDKGIHKENISDFLDNVDLVVDGLDFFNVDERRMLFNTSHKLNIPLITAGPIGFSTAYLIFTSKSPNFDKYFGVNNKSTYYEKLIAFGLGLAPKLLQKKYMKNVPLKQKKGASFSGAVNLAAGVTSIEAIKLLLDKGETYAVPYSHQFDVFRNIYVKKKAKIYGHNPIHQMKIKIGMKLLLK